MSSDDKMLDLADAIRFKEKLTIRFSGTLSSDGTMSVNLDPPFKPRRSNATYTISLITLSTTGLIANLDEKSNKFYYSVGSGSVKTITLDKGFYMFDTYNTEVKQQIKENKDDETAITLSVSPMSGLVSVKLEKGYKVYFNREKTWRHCLGFDAVDLTTDGIHKSTRTASWKPTQEVYVHCSACRGNISINNKGRREESDIIFNFPVANARYGAPLTFQIDPRLTESELDLCNGGQLSRMTLGFTDDAGKPITFGNTLVSVALRIIQV
jgi:hypothetical protein